MACFIAISGLATSAAALEADAGIEMLLYRALQEMAKKTQPRVGYTQTRDLTKGKRRQHSISRESQRIVDGPLQPASGTALLFLLCWSLLGVISFKRPCPKVLYLTHRKGEIV